MDRLFVLMDTCRLNCGLWDVYGHLFGTHIFKLLGIKPTSYGYLGGETYDEPVVEGWICRWMNPILSMAKQRSSTAWWNETSMDIVYWNILKLLEYPDIRWHKLATVFTRFRKLLPYSDERITSLMWQIKKTQSPILPYIAINAWCKLSPNGSLIIGFTTIPHTVQRPATFL